MIDHTADVLRYAMECNMRMENYLLWKEAIWAVRHPNKAMFRSYHWTAIIDKVIPVGMVEYLQNQRWEHGHVRGVLALPDTRGQDDDEC